MTIRTSRVGLESPPRGEECPSCRMEENLARRTPRQGGHLECALRIRAHNADGMNVTRESRQAPTAGRARLAPMGLLSPPTDEMRAAAHALIHGQPRPQVADKLLLAAIDQVDRELTPHERQICKDLEREPAESPAHEALELALAQRISSTRLALASGEHQPEIFESESPPAASASRRRSLDR
jgi:hypothetical protein